MNAQPTLERDERTVSIENASYRWAFLLLTYALLLDVMYRGYVRHEAAWDLMGFIVIAGGFCHAYQAHYKTLPQNWTAKAVVVACIAAVIGAILAFAVRWTH